MGVLAVVVFVVDRNMRPFHDEWWYICGRALGNLDSLFRPHNEHWVTLHVIAYRTLVDLFGIGTYAPILVLLLLSHAAVAAAVLRLTRSLLPATVMVFFGAGYENLFWGFQIGFVAATALGLWALVAFLEGRVRLGAALLLAAVATQGTGLFVVPSIVVILLASRRARDVVWIIPAILGYAVWFALEHDAIAFRGSVVSIESVVGFTVVGMLGAVGFGAGPALAVGNVVLLAAARARSITPGVVAGATGLLATFVALALVRQGFSEPTSSRYLYIAAPFMLMVVAGIESKAARPIAAKAVLYVALAVNVTLLVVFGSRWPGIVAAARAGGSDIPPPGVCFQSALTTPGSLDRDMTAVPMDETIGRWWGT
jgi:hypothetical protein